MPLRMQETINTDSLVILGGLLKLYIENKGKEFFLKTMGSSMEDVKVDKPNNGSTPCLNNFWTIDSHGKTSWIN